MCTRRLKIKKLVTLAALIIFASSLFTCDIFSPNENNPQAVDRPQNTNTDTESYTVTVYLDGSPPVFSISSRSLTKELAVFGHDYFEVTFVRPQAGGQIIARASWEKGHAAGVSGVARGVDYQYTSVTAATLNNAGAALLFVGKRSDRTLLGIGQLTGTDDGGPTSTFISADTKSVTFTVTALKAGTNEDFSLSSFKTSISSSMTPLNEDVFPVIITSRVFPLNRLDMNLTYYGQYIIDVGGFEAGILRAGAITLAVDPSPLTTSSGYHLRPRYPNGDGTHEAPQGAPATFPFDTNTVVTPLNNTAGTTFDRDVRFSINTTGTNDGSVFAFAFEIPVYPLTNNDNRGTPPRDDLWYIRPAYDSYLYDLDDGKSGTGGAILIGTGEIDQSRLYTLWVSPPYKQRYYDNTPPTSDDWVFDVDGIIIYIRTAGNPVKRLYPHEVVFKIRRVVAGVVTEIVITPGEDIYTYLHDPQIMVDPGVTMIYVEYVDPDYPDLEPAGFPVYTYDPGSGGIPGASEIPFENRIVISNSLDVQRLDTLTPGKYLILLYASQNFASVNVQGGYTFIILAAVPGVVIGKNGTGGGFVNNGITPEPNIYYFGIWPYNEQLIIGGRDIGNGDQFRVNPMGTYQTIDDTIAGTPEMPGSYFIQHTYIYSCVVTEGPGVIVAKDPMAPTSNLVEPW